MKKIKKWIPLFILALIFTGVWSSGVGEFLTIENFQTHKTELTQYVQIHYGQAIAIFAFIYITTVALSLPFAALLTFIGGFLFGTVFGTAVVAVSATIGATIIFWIAQSSLGETLRHKAGGLYKKVEKDMHENAFSYLLFLRFVPLFPFFIVNILPALFNVRTSTYIITTFFGILPGTAVYVNVGRSLGTVNNPADLVSPDIILAISLLGVFALIPVLYQKIKKRKARNNV